MFGQYDLLNIIYTIIALLCAIIPHEIAHGYAAYKLGDDTAKSDGRLSLNPLNHIDPIGLLSMIIFKFGWAKAVPINPYKFKNRKRDTLIVSLAGVVTNFVIGFIASLAFVFAYYKSSPVTELFQSIMWYNVMLGVFNLVPIPPLDGSKALISLFPNKIEYFFYKYERYLYILLIIALASGTISKVIGPIILGIINKFIDVGMVLWNTI
ncbi:peptidase, M50 family [Peptoniphilus sp. ING2-D1G]|nr:peptidase, M50 family [Peptoniphilus sp. ING2-D1G]